MITDDDRPKKHRQWQGLTIGIENPKGSTRSGSSPDGKKWSTAMTADYAHFSNVIASDGDAVDVFVQDWDESLPIVHVVNQVDPATQTFDEHKTIIGPQTIEEASALYLSNYDDGWQGLGSITGITVPGLKNWLRHGDKSLPLTPELAEAHMKAAMDEETAKLQQEQVNAQGQPDSSGEVEGETDAAQQGTEAEAGDAQAEVQVDVPVFAPLLDALLLSGDGYRILDESGAIVDAAKLGKPGENGPLRVSLLASLVGKPNSNGRYFTPGYMRKAAPMGNDYIKRMGGSVTGEDPHPPFDPERGQYKTACENECWDCLNWHTDSTGNLWSTVKVDETTPKGARIGSRIRQKQKLGVSVRWVPLGNAAKSARLDDGTPVDYYDEDAAALGFFPLALDHVVNPAFPQAGYAMFDCEGFCELPTQTATLDAQLITVSTDTVTETTETTPCACQQGKEAATDAHDTSLHTATSLSPSQAILTETLDAAIPHPDAGGSPSPESGGKTHTPVRGTTTPPSEGQSNSRKGQENQKQMATAITDADVKKLTAAQRKEKLREIRKALKAATDADEISTLAASQDALLDATDDDDMEDAKTEGKKEDAKESAVDATAATVAALKALGIDPEALKDVKATLDAQKAKAALDAAKAEVDSFVSAVADGTVDGIDLARFDADDRELLSGIAAGASTVDAAKAAVVKALPVVDAAIAKRKAAALGMTDNGAKGITVQDEKRGQETEVKVTLDEGDKAVKALYAKLDAALDENRRANNLPVDEKLRGYNQEHFIKELREKRGLNSPEVKAAIADSAKWLLSDKEGKKKIEAGKSHRAALDAGLILTPQAALDAAATTNTGTLLNQASIASFMLERKYQDCTSLQYMGGITDGAYVQIPGVQGKVGTVLRIPTKYRQPAAHDYGADFNSLVVAESTGIPSMSVYDSFQDWGITRRRLATTISRDVESAIAHGPLVNLDPVVYAISQLTDEFSIDTDNKNYLTMGRASDEIGAKAVSLEVVASGNLAYNAGGNATQDGVTYGANVVAVAQIAPGVNPGTSRSASLSNASTSADFGVPICMPRTVPTISAGGAYSTTQKNAVSVQIGSGSPLVQGYLDSTGQVQSYAGSTAVYAVDWKRGKVVFTAGSTVTSGTTTLKLSYSAVTNATYYRLNYTAADGGFPSSLTRAEYLNDLLYTMDAANAKLASSPNFVMADTVLTSMAGSVNIQNAAMFYALLSPNGTSLGDTRAIPGKYANRKGMDYCDANAVMPWGDDTALLFKRGTVRYGVDTPYTVEGPFPSYDSNGDPVDDVKYFAREFSIFAHPTPQDVNANILQYYYTKVKFY